MAASKYQYETKLQLFVNWTHIFIPTFVPYSLYPYPLLGSPPPGEHFTKQCWSLCRVFLSSLNQHSVSTYLAKHLHRNWNTSKAVKIKKNASVKLLRPNMVKFYHFLQSLTYLLNLAEFCFQQCPRNNIYEHIHVMCLGVLAQKYKKLWTIQQNTS